MAADPSIRQLRYLVALAEHLHFGDAAVACGVSQPNLSSQIRELERGLDTQLVERTSRKVMLTPAGQEVVEYARRILNDVDDLVRVAANDTGALTGRLRLGVIPTVAPYVLPRVLPAVRAAYPALELQLVEDFTDRLVSRLQSGELDLLLLALPVHQSGLHEEVLAEEPFVLLTRRDHDLAQARSVTPEAIEGQDLLLLQEGHCLRDQALAVCHLASGTARPVVEGSSLNTLVQMVANGFGITLLPQIAVEVDVHSSDEVAVIPFGKPQPGRTLGLVWRDSSNRAEAFGDLANLLRKELKRLLKDAALPSRR